MARPQRVPVPSGTQGWDAFLETNLVNLFDNPFGGAEHAGDETDLEATYPAASFDRCFIWVDHTTLGWARYVSDGTAWAIDKLLSPPAVADIPAAASAAELKVNELLGVLRQANIIS